MFVILTWGRLAGLLPVADEHVKMVNILHAPNNAYLPDEIIKGGKKRKYYHPVIIKRVINKKCSIKIDILEKSSTHSKAHLENQ